MPQDVARNDDSRVLHNADREGGVSAEFLNDFMMGFRVGFGPLGGNKQALSGAEAAEKIQELGERACKALGFGTCELFESGKNKK
jgi:hypothetical protein